jgi:hypothetical protein
MRTQEPDHKAISDSTAAKSPVQGKDALSARASHSDKLKLVEAIYDSVNEHMIEHVAALLATTPSHLDTLLETCTNRDKEISYLAIQRFIKSEGDNVTRQFFITLNDRLKAGTKKDDDEDTLALVSEEEMEEMVATTTMHAHAMNLCSDELNQLEVRLEYLEITTDGSIEKESLNPRRLAEAFLLTLKSLNVELTQRLKLFELFDTDVTPKLESLYKEVNAMLIQAGVMPRIVLNNVKAEETDDGEAISTRSAKYYDPQEKVEANFIPRTPQDMAYLANQFMMGQFVPSENAVGLPESFTRPVGKQDVDGKSYYARKDVMQALSQLQNQILSKGKEHQQASIDEIKQSLFNEIGKQSGGVITKQVNTLDERSIDFVGMMFDAIMHDSSLSSIIKNLLLRLQIPVIKVAMSDTNLFQRDDHPTREVLNLVSEAGKGVTEEQDRVYGELETIIDGVLEEFDVDIESFNQAADSLRKLIESEQQISLENEKREQQAVMVAHAREIVVTEIQKISTNKIIPSNVLPLVTKSWPSLMVNRYIKNGIDSWPWLESVMLMKLLVKCLQPIKSNGQWQMVWSNHMALIDAVKEELYTTKQNRDSITDQVETLKDTFIELLDAYGYKLTENEELSPVTEDESMVHYDAPAANDENVQTTNLEEVVRLAQEKLGQLPSMVHPGVWFEIYNGDDKAVRRLKLSVILTGIAKLVFVDRKGIKVIEKDAADFAAELTSEKSRFIADHSTFEHALGKVIHSIAA